MSSSVVCQPQLSQPSGYGSLSSGSMLTIFCDFDGPLVDVSERYYSTYRCALEATESFYQTQSQFLGLNPLTKEQFWGMKQERVCDLEIAMRSGLQESQMPYFLEKVREIVNHPELLDQDRIQPGVNWALPLLHARGVRLVLVTLRPEAQVQQILRNYGLNRLFTDIYGTQDLDVAYQNNSEVKTQLLKSAIARYRSCSQSMLMIGDTEADILAAQATGIPVVAVTCGIRSCDYLQQFEPDYICNDLLSSAHFLLNLMRYRE